MTAPNLLLNLDEVERLKSRATSDSPLWQKLWANDVEEAEEGLATDPDPVVGDYDPGEVGVYVDGHMDASMTEEGVLPLDRKRANGYGYSTYTLNAWCLAVEIARHQGEDLYNFTVKGKGIRLAMQFDAGFFTGEKSARELFDSDMTVEQKGDPSPYELGVKTWPDDAKQAAVPAAVGRESWEKHILRWPALTHGVDEVAS